MFEVGGPLEIVECELDGPGEHEVRLKVTASGVCHSDLGVLSGNVPVPLPMVLGHEACGIVTEVGPEVRSVAVGDQVIMGPELQCGECFYCSRCQPELCEIRSLAAGSGGLADGTSRFRIGTQPVHQFVCAGTFAEETVVSEYSVVKVDRDIPPASAALMACAVATGFGAATNMAMIRPGDAVVVFGCGGVGLNVIQGARYREAGCIMAVDLVEWKLDTALRFGATNAINPRDGDVVQQVRALTDGRGADVTFEVVGNPTTIQQAWEATRRGGQTTLVGGTPAHTTLEIPVQTLVSTERRLQGVSYGGTNLSQAVPLWVQLYLEGRLLLDELITETVTLTGLNQALDAMHHGNVLRAVVQL
jgi:Zn-dependent alcohol dehydrogenase